MPNINCAAIMASLVVASTNLFNGLAFAHQNRDRHHGHHHKNQKQKSYNKGYHRGYKKALKKQYKYCNHTLVYYQTIRRPLVVASFWRAPRTVIVNPNYFQFSGPRIDVGYSFSL